MRTQTRVFAFVENGGEVRLAVLPGGRVRTWVEIDTFYDEWDAKLTLSGSTLTSVPEEETRPIQVHTFVLEGSTLTLTNVEDSFDFSFSGAPEVSATSVGVFELTVGKTTSSCYSSGQSLSCGRWDTRTR